MSFCLNLLERYLFNPQLSRILQREGLHLKERSSRNLVILDIGANTGQSIIFYQKLFGEVEIHSFEPNPSAFDKLRKHRSATTHVYKRALAESKGFQPFFISKLSETSTLILPKINSTWNKKKARVLGMDPGSMYELIETEVDTVDEFLLGKNISEVNLMKIDVEGGELGVLKGALKSLSKGVISVVQFEQHLDDLRESTFHEIHLLLTSMNFIEFASVKHPFGKFYEKVYLLQQST